MAHQIPDEIPRIDARNIAQRDMAKFLREQHLPGVDTDDDASVTLEIEQARLTLLASAGVIAFEVTQILAAKRAICVTPAYVSMALLLIAMCGAWIGLVWAENLRRFRVSRRYKIYHGELSEYLRLEPSQPVDRYPTDATWSGQIKSESNRRRAFRVYRFAIAFIAALGIASGVLSAVGTADLRRCHFEVLKASL